MKISIDFEHPFFDEGTVMELKSADLDGFYQRENAVNRMNLFLSWKRHCIDYRAKTG